MSVMQVRMLSALATSAFASALVLGGTGCLRLSPKMPKTLAVATPTGYSPAQFDKDVASYRSDVEGNLPEQARELRDQIVYRVMAQVDHAYGEYENKLLVRRAGVLTGFDAAGLGLTAATTVVGANGIKDILSASATALGGTRISVDKNYFEEKTTEALVSQMRASRRSLKADMLDRLSKSDVRQYPLEAAWVDLVQYFYAGTLPSALVEVANSAGAAAKSAQIDLDEVVQSLPKTTHEQAQQAISIRGVYRTLSRKLASGDADAVRDATQTLRRIVTVYGDDPSADTSGKALLELLGKAMDDAAMDDAKLAKLTAAVQSAEKR